LKHLFPLLTATALLLVTALPGSAWAAAAFNKTLKLQGISFQVLSRGEGSQQQLDRTELSADSQRLQASRPCTPAVIEECLGTAHW
jgi:hypothetical protein